MRIDDGPERGRLSLITICCKPLAAVITAANDPHNRGQKQYYVRMPTHNLNSDCKVTIIFRDTQVFLHKSSIFAKFPNKIQPSSQMDFRQAPKQKRAKFPNSCKIICIYQKKVVPLQRISKLNSYECL